MRTSATTSACLALLLGPLALGAVGCTARGINAGGGLSAVPRGGLTSHGAEDRRDDTELASTELAGAELAFAGRDVEIHAEPPRLAATDEDGALFLTRVHVVNRSDAWVDAPRVRVRTERVLGDRRVGCEIRYEDARGDAHLPPNAARVLRAYAHCPVVMETHEVRSSVSLPDLAEGDDFLAGVTPVLVPDV